MGSFGGFYKGEKKKPKQGKKDKGGSNAANIFAKPEYRFPTLVEKKKKAA